MAEVNRPQGMGYALRYGVKALSFAISGDAVLLVP